MPENEPGSLVGIILDGKYRLDGLLGAGGFGAVYRGWHLLLDVPVAVKVAFRIDGARGRRFRREARTLMTLSHPQIVRMYDYGRDREGHVYMVQSFVEGQPLNDVVAELGPLPTETVVELGLQALAALEYAHAHGVVHRDVKPANLMLGGTVDRPTLKLLDFGIAKMQGAVRDESDLTRPGGAPGTPAYMAPEQIEGRAEPASDLYALGGTLFLLTTGRKPYPLPAPRALVAHLSDPVPELPCGVDAGLAEVIRRAMAKRPAERYLTAADMASALSAVGRSLPGSGPSGRPLAAAGLPPLDTIPSKMPPMPIPLPPTAIVGPARAPSDISSTSNEMRGVFETVGPPAQERPEVRVGWSWVAALIGAVGSVCIAWVWWSSDAPDRAVGDRWASVGAWASEASAEPARDAEAPDALVFTRVVAWADDAGVGGPERAPEAEVHPSVALARGSPVERHRSRRRRRRPPAQRKALSREASAPGLVRAVEDALEVCECARARRLLRRLEATGDQRASRAQRLHRARCIATLGSERACPR